MSIDLFLLIAVMIFVFISLIKAWLVPELAFFFALSIITIFGVITPEEALKGFSNPGVHTVALLFVLAHAVYKNGVLMQFSQKILGMNKSIQIVLIKLMLPIFCLSAFLNNTPIVSMMTPVIRNWGEKNGVSPSKLLIPLSYAAILGGMITLIGTSTNLIIDGLLQQKGYKGFQLFEFAIIGIPLSLTGLFYMMIIGHRLLPNRKVITEKIKASSHEYIFEIFVLADSPLVGQTITEAKLRELHNLFLIKIIRNNQSITPASNSEIIQANDRLIFSGNIQTVNHIQTMKGTKLVTNADQTVNNHQLIEFENLTEVVISHSSPLIGKKIKESNFRSKYNAAIIAIRRKHKDITSGIGCMTLKPGDTLLLIAGNDFLKTWSDSKDFYFVSKVMHTPYNKKYFVLVIIIGMFISILCNVLSLLKAAMLGVVILFLTKSINMSEAKKAMHWDVLLIMASAIGIGAAIEKTGLSVMIADLFTSWGEVVGLLGIAFLFYLITNILTDIINNLAAAAIMFPIGFEISMKFGYDPKMFAIITAIAASCSFMTPIGYQTNLLVYGPGGYRYTDYMKVGFPLSVLCMIVTVLISAQVWG
ncbi:SLC13 family permease [Bacillus sp. FJAT-47783]|uniref:SLC13 family permease n=1 Tax=Bacillus sp. FJAT-47783 TaxID=2922712 RepID=UPI001FADFA54|nr:SLC13 family permease [Bacillus sp. FJAT-47783]